MRVGGFNFLNFIYTIMYKLKNTDAATKGSVGGDEKVIINFVEPNIYVRYIYTLLTSLISAKGTALSASGSHLLPTKSIIGSRSK